MDALDHRKYEAIQLTFKQVYVCLFVFSYVCCMETSA